MTLCSTRRRDRKRTKDVCEVRLNGRVQDLNRIYYVDIRRGVIRRWCVNEEGKKYGGWEEPRPEKRINGIMSLAAEEVRGRVKLKFKKV